MAKMKIQGEIEVQSVKTGKRDRINSTIGYLAKCIAVKRVQARFDELVSEEVKKVKRELTEMYECGEQSQKLSDKIEMN